MNKPKVKTKKYVDWIDLRNWFVGGKHKEDFAKYKDEIWMWFCKTSDFGNGHYVVMEEEFSEPGEYPEGIAWLTRILESFSRNFRTHARVIMVLLSGFGGKRNKYDKR